MTALAPLRLDPGQLARLRDDMAAAIAAGLGRPGQEVRALPAYLRRPAAGLSGRAVVLDVGGTNMRAAEVELVAGTARLTGASRGNDLMRQATRRDFSRDAFFDAQAELVTAVSAERDLNVGYCFSYPATITPEREAVLIEWTKGIRISGVEGQAVGALLRDALRRRGRRTRAIPVLNDTVASLLAGAEIGPEFDHTIGLIVGTGTNMAGFFPVRAIPKLGAVPGWRADEMMAVNLESGDYTPRDILTAWDDGFDASLPPEERNRQRFEKAVSGAYLPWLLAEVAGGDACAGAGFDPRRANVHAGTVAALRDHPVLGAAATLLIDRSADMVAAGLAAVIVAMGGPSRIGILVEGSLFHKTPGYPERVADRLRQLAPNAQAAFIAGDDGGVPANMLGAASAALTP